MNSAPLGSPRLERLVKQLAKMPGIGQKSAMRIALHLLESGVDESEVLVESLREVKEHVRPCSRCGAICEADLCGLCQDPRRQTGQLCVVEQPHDVFALERAAIFRGRYHVLGGLLSPLDGVEPADLRLGSLAPRVAGEEIREVVLALSGSVEGEATALYVARQLAGHPVDVSRLATGIPVGGHLDFVDDVTLERAFSGRRSLG